MDNLYLAILSALVVVSFVLVDSVSHVQCKLECTIVFRLRKAPLHMLAHGTYALHTNMS